MGTVIAACAASTSIQGTQRLCPQNEEWVAFGCLILGCIIFATARAVIEVLVAKHKERK